MLDQFLTSPRIVDIDHIDVSTPPAVAYQAVRHFDLGNSPLLHRLFRAIGMGPSICVEDLCASGRGFVVLHDAPGECIVVGAIGRFWQELVSFAAFTPEQFVKFAEPGWGKLAWSVSITPISEGHSRITVELRAAATDAHTWSSFRAWHINRPLWRLLRGRDLDGLAETLGPLSPDVGWDDIGDGTIDPFAMLLAFFTPRLRPRRAHWWVDGEFEDHPYAGDELIPEPRWSWTHSVEVDAPVAAVWPWLAMLGQKRAGFHGHELLTGCATRTIDRVPAKWQTLDPGDALRLHPRIPAMTIASLEPGRWFVAEVHADVRTGEPSTPSLAPEHRFVASWLLLVEPIDGGRRSRIVSRFRTNYGDTLASRLAYGPLLLEPVGVQVDHDMLLALKERAETACAPRERPVSA